jgi:putative holliday junction resolvase
MPILPSAFDLPAGRLLALDLGRVRIGVAACDEQGLLASPLTVIRRHATRAEDFAAIADLARRERAVALLVGMPASFDEGGGSEQARWTRRYAGRLARALEPLGVPLAFWDETLTSVSAAELLAASGGKTGIDAAAATVLLDDYLAARRARESAPGAPEPFE